MLKSGDRRRLYVIVVLVVTFIAVPFPLFVLAMGLAAMRAHATLQYNFRIPPAGYATLLSALKRPKQPLCWWGRHPPCLVHVAAAAQTPLPARCCADTANKPTALQFSCHAQRPTVRHTTLVAAHANTTRAHAAELGAVGTGCTRVLSHLVETSLTLVATGGHLSSVAAQRYGYFTRQMTEASVGVGALERG